MLRTGIDVEFGHALEPALGGADAWAWRVVAAVGQTSHHGGEGPQDREDLLLGRCQAVDPAGQTSVTHIGRPSG